MNRNFSAEYVHSTVCKFGCGKTLFWNELKHYYADGPKPTDTKHKCIMEPKKSDIVDVMNQNTNDISQQLMSILDAISLLKKYVWENQQQTNSKLDQILDVISREHGFGISAATDIMGDHE